MAVRWSKDGNAASSSASSGRHRPWHCLLADYLRRQPGHSPLPSKVRTARKSSYRPLLRRRLPACDSTLDFLTGLLLS
jgi:hypothetical protein